MSCITDVSYSVLLNGEATSFFTLERDNFYLTHLLFVDDILIFLNDSIGDSTTLHNSMLLFQRATDGIKYLGFRLKPNGYRIVDWLWLIAKVEKRLQVWYHRYLSRAGRLILIKAVIEATPVYWMALTWIPKGILNRLQHICSRFLWTGQQP
eukprot:PITA_36677